MPWAPTAAGHFCLECVLDVLLGLSPVRHLPWCFQFDSTPQGFSFWWDIAGGRKDFDCARPILLHWVRQAFIESRAERRVFRDLCEDVLRYYHGEAPYDFRSLNPYDRDNARHDAWSDISQRLSSALKDFP